MTKTIRFGAATVAMFAAMGMTSAASAQDSATATATAEIFEALTVTNNAPLDFGTLVVDAAGGVNINPGPGEVSSCSGSVICIGTSNPALFVANGQPGAIIDITLPSAAGELRHTGNLTSTNPEHNIDLALSLGATTLGLDAVNGDAGFHVGGSLNLDGSEIAGTYTTTFDVTVNYQ